MTVAEDVATGGAAQATPLTRALDTVRRLRAERDAARGSGPVAVVGAGLRFPGGVVDLDSYWNVLAEGADLVRPMPPERMEPFTREWEHLPQVGGFFDEVMDFDADFFGIDEEEATALDPQHRLLLEVAWEALENAALPPDRLDSGRTGLFVGITNNDYWDRLDGDPDRNWSMGNGHYFAVGRTAYALGVGGPALAVDTACSSSLVAVHLARQALARGECDTALAGGVSLVLSPRMTRQLDAVGALAADGRCRSFDARANGFVRAEGCGVVVLKRLVDARRDGDRVLGVIKGSAVNQYGRSTGFTAPNVLSLTALMETALADAELTAADIGLVEAHGTATPIGDAIELEAVAAAFGGPDRTSPLPVGTVKANLGHAESAAGVAALLKGIACLRYGAVPPLPGFTTPNPMIELADTGLVLPDRLEPWRSPGRCVAVNAFSMGGTNAQLILAPADGLGEADGAEEPDGRVPSGPAEAGGFEVSAHTPEALRTYAAALGDRLLELDDADYPAFAYTASQGRARHPWYVRVEAADRTVALAALQAVAAGESEPSRRDPAQDADTPPGPPRAVIDLPAYPWQRRRYAPAPVERTPTAPAPEGDPGSGGDTRLVLRDGSPRSDRAGGRAADAEGDNVRLLAARPGLLGSVAPTSWRRFPPGPGQVEIEVAAAGLNFSDALKAMGTYPGTAGPVPLGIECAGRISVVGEGVTGLRAGDPVIAVATSAAAAYTTTEAHLVARRPEGLSDTQAAAVPIAYLTALHALGNLARLRAGETVLIHSATGGVGQAALAVARARGAEVFATAGSEEKRELLRRRGLPADRVYDSRSLAFADAVDAATGGRGVDVVLNSLTGDALVRSLGLLAPGGRLIELGKRDIADDSIIGLGAFAENRALLAVDLDAVLWERPEEVQELFEALLRGFATEVLSPIDVTAHPLRSAPDVLADMARARHVGKLVLVPDRDGPLVPPPGGFLPRPDTTYAAWGPDADRAARLLAEAGARRIVLVDGAEKAKKAAAGLRARGVRAETVPPSEDTSGLLDRLRGSAEPLAGLAYAGPAGERATHLRELAREHGMDFLETASADAATATGAGEPDEENRERIDLIRRADPSRRRTLLVAHVVGLAAETLGQQAGTLDPAAPLARLGFDSVRTLELRARLQGSLGVALPATVGWRYPTIDALVPYLAERLDLPLSSGDASAEAPRGGPAPVAAGPAREREDAGTEGIDGLTEGELGALLLAKAREMDEQSRR
ncbi:beta-ketoacyl synthase N-terminal-like domain-containing protein [Nocardiopsis dassonvillei]|uniref:beta-ketoacyl synthase N-terminal-like domain-containing protein n=1 Tax=Nocardiopsis dassonvillei TaxID=2014 RepID=UPI000B9D6998|nr:beta-ketoacyl synthase N-terminal-like domain-containing protein [Nocardiopsis dassonvillei]ASU58193.1 hypothetical protein CGQ36_11800 [Nocardiopsis dassonvillei]